MCAYMFCVYPHTTCKFYRTSVKYREHTICPLLRPSLTSDKVAEWLVAQSMKTKCHGSEAHPGLFFVFLNNDWKRSECTETRYSRYQYATGYRRVLGLAGDNDEIKCSALKYLKPASSWAHNELGNDLIDLKLGTGFLKSSK